MAITGNRNELFSLVDFVNGIAPGSSPDEQKRASQEIFLSQLSQRKGGKEVEARPGLPLPAVRDLQQSTATAGGNLVASNVARVEAAARPRLVLEALGAQRLEAPAAQDLSLTVWRSDVSDWSAHWIAEGAASPKFQPLTVGSVMLTAKCAATRLAFSRRMALQAVGGIEALLLDELTRACRVIMERGFLQGGGGLEPLGVYRTPGLGTQSFSGATPTLSELAGMVGTAAGNNVDLSRCGWLVSAADFATLMRTQSVAANDDMLVEFADNRYRILGFPVEVSTNAITGKILFGDWSTVRTAFFGPAQVVADRYSNGKSTTGQVELVVLNYCDLALTEPSHIVLGSA